MKIICLVVQADKATLNYLSRHCESLTSVAMVNRLKWDTGGEKHDLEIYGNILSNFS